MRDELIRVFVASLTSVARVCVIAGIGAGLARTDVLDTAARRSVAKLLTYALLPMLMLTKVAAAIARAQGLVHWLVLPLSAFGHVAAGLTLTRLLRSTDHRFERVPTDETADEAPAPVTDGLDALVALAVSFPNSGALPIALVESLCKSQSCEASTVGFISFYIAVLNPLMWVVGPRLLGVSLTNDLSLTARIKATPPPVVAAIVGAVVGFVPPLFRLLRDSLLGSAFDVVGDAAIPVGIINLGAAVASNAAAKDHNGMPPALLFGATGLRLIVIPALSIALTNLLRGTFLVPDASPLTLVLMLEAAPPPAMQSMVFLQLFDLNHLERPLSQLFVLSYLTALLTLTTWIAVILTLLQDGDKAASLLQ